jgi:hypothetical protein
MKRTIVKLPLNNNAAELSTFASALVGRANLAAKMGTQTFGGDRNIYQALG